MRNVTRPVPPFGDWLHIEASGKGLCRALMVYVLQEKKRVWTCSFPRCPAYNFSMPAFVHYPYRASFARVN
jgi:hypothetical protein